MTPSTVGKPTVRSELDDDVMVLTLDRPDRMNAMTGAMSEELTAAVRAANADDAVGAIVVTGAGRAFCAGADVSDSFAAQLDDDQQMPYWQEWLGLVRSAKPMVAAVNGVAYGVGLTMILPFDRIVAAPDARFSVRFIRMGLVPELGSTHYLPQRVGFGAASDLMLSGRIVEADQAVRMGLADELADDVVAGAVRCARSYAQNAPTALRYIKELLTRNATDTDLDAVQARELELLLRCFSSAEHAEAVAAFLEKRPPRFSPVASRW